MTEIFFGEGTGSLRDFGEETGRLRDFGEGTRRLRAERFW